MKYLRVFGAISLVTMITCLGCRKEKITPPIKIENAPQLLFSRTFGGDKDDYFGTIVRTAVEVHSQFL